MIRRVFPTETVHGQFKQQDCVADTENRCNKTNVFRQSYSRLCFINTPKAHFLLVVRFVFSRQKEDGVPISLLFLLFRIECKMRFRKQEWVALTSLVLRTVCALRSPRQFSLFKEKQNSKCGRTQTTLAFPILLLRQNSLNCLRLMTCWKNFLKKMKRFQLQLLLCWIRFVLLADTKSKKNNTCAFD